VKPYAPATNLGRTRAGDDIHHRTADQPREAAKKSAKAAKHGARQDGQAQARAARPE
jgi:hypothetical protein